MSIMDKNIQQAPEEGKKPYEAPVAEELALGSHLSLLAAFSVEGSLEDLEDWEDM